MKKLCACALIVGLGLSGCSPITSCTPSLVPAIRLVVNDGSTGTILTGETIIHWTGPNVVADSFSVVLVPGAEPVNIGFVPGTYGLSVRHAGYTDWNQSVAVSGDRCEPQTKLVTASLSPK